MGRPTRQQTAEREVQYRDLYDAGLTCTAIAEKVGVSTSAVAQWCRREGIPPHGVGNAPHADRPPPDPADDRRPIPSCPGYTASRAGRVYSERTDPAREMTAHVHAGQWRVTLSVGGRVRYRLAADLVLEAWVGTRPDGHLVHAKDGDRLNAALSNLEWRSGIARIDLAELVRVWQSAVTVAEVCERLAVSYPTVVLHIARLRAEGVPIKEMRPPADIAELKRIAEGDSPSSTPDDGRIE